MEKSLPVMPENRAGVLDALRGFALLGICLANAGYFSMYIFKSPPERASMPFPVLDHWLANVHYALIDGKFYSIFSMLFGIGFSIIFFGKGDGKKLSLFYRRLIILLGIGLVHGFLIWDGDILIFYALAGMVLPLFRNLSARALVITASVMLVSPIIFDVAKVISDNRLNISRPFLEIAMAQDRASGIEEKEVADWVLRNTGYDDLRRWNKSGLLWGWYLRMEGNRVLKIMGMFLIGLAVGKLRMYDDLARWRPKLRRILFTMLAVGLAGGLLKVVGEHDGVSLPKWGGLLDTLGYTLNVAPLALAYACLFALYYSRGKSLPLLENVGRMALTNYILQSIICLFIYYGFGLGMATRIGPSGFMPIAIAVFLLQIAYSTWWLRHFQFGPLEWIWRQLTYGKRIAIGKS